MSNSHADVIVQGTGTYIGGLVGSNTDTVENSDAKGNVSGRSYVGGLVGGSNSIIRNSSASGTVTGTQDYVGGLLGANFADDDGYGEVSNSFASGTVSGRNSVGGLVGVNEYTITNTYASGNVTGSTGVGGLVGSNSSGASVQGSYASGTTTSNNNAAMSQVGGLVGGNNGNVADSYATGAVSGFYAGGLIGKNYGTVNRTYASGAVTPLDLTTPISISGTAGGLVASNYGTVSNSFWNTETSGRSTSAGGTGSIGKSSTELQNISTFASAGWDIDDAGGTGKVWRIYEGHSAPLLRSFLTQLTVTANSGSRTYDGTTNGLGVSYSTTPNSNLLGTATATASSRNVGAYSVTPGGLYSNQQGYDIVTASGTVAITKADLTVTTNAVSKTYDGTTSAAGAAIVANGTLYGSDSLSGGSFAYSNKHAGSNKVVSVSGVTVNDGNSGGNYNVSYLDNTSSSIAKADLVISSSNVSKTYDGTTSAAGSAVAANDTILHGSDSLSGGSFAYSNKHAGSNKVVSVSGVTVNDGNSGGNYNVSYVDNTSSSIAKADLTVTANDASKTFNGQPYSGGNGVSYSGFVAGEDSTVLQGTPGYTGSSQGATATGTYDITPTGLESGDYNIHYVNGELTIKAANNTATVLSSLTSQQTGINGTGDNSGGRSAPGTQDINQNSGPGAGAQSLGRGTPILVADNRALASTTTDAASGLGIGAPQTQQVVGFNTNNQGVTLNFGGDVSATPVAQRVLPVFMKTANGTTPQGEFDVNDHVGRLTVKSLGATDKPVPADNAGGRNAEGSIPLTGGGEVKVSITVSAEGVLAIELPPEAANFSPEQAMLMGVALARQQLGVTADTLTAVVIHPH